MLNDASYIRNGLVLWLDGIDKGSTSGTWTDKVAGHVFESVNGFTDGSNYVGLNASSSQYFRNSTFESIGRFDGTIEVVISDYTKGSMIFIPKLNGGMAFGVRASTNHIITSSEGNNVKMVAYGNEAKIFSICNNTRAFINGSPTSFGDPNYWDNPDTTYNYIGRRNYSSNYNYATAKIYALRIYNRLLTQAEIMHNQRIDNKRFGFGLNI